MMNSASQASKAGNGSLPLGQLLAYAFPNLAIQMVGFAVLTVIPAFYAKHTAVSLAAVGTILTFSRLFDAVSDPVIGYLSDRTKSPIGSRKPWIIGAALLGMIAIYFLFNPPEDAGALYFLVWTFGFYIAWTCHVIPYSAWGSELARDHVGRSRIFYYAGLASVLGTVAFLSAPLLPRFDTADMSPEVMKFVGWCGIGLLPAALLTAVFWVPQGETVTVNDISFRQALRGVARNRPLWRYLALYGAGGFGAGVKIALGFIFVDSYLGIGDKFAYVMMGYAIGQLIGMPVWGRVIIRFGKSRSWAVSWAVSAVVTLCIVLVPQGQAGFIPILMIFSARGLLAGADFIIPPALLADIIDYDILKTGVNKAGSYYSLMAMLVKGLGALGAGLSFIALAAFGYDVKPDAVNDALANFGMAFIIVAVPMILYLVGFALLWRFPINEKRHKVILRRITQRAERAGVSVG